MTTVIRPLRRAGEGRALSRDERYELLRGSNCWQVRSKDAKAAERLLRLGKPPVCHLRRELADWLEAGSPEPDKSLPW